LRFACPAICSSASTSAGAWLLVRGSSGRAWSRCSARWASRRPPLRLRRVRRQLSASTCSARGTCLAAESRRPPSGQKEGAVAPRRVRLPLRRRARVPCSPFRWGECSCVVGGRTAPFRSVVAPRMRRSAGRGCLRVGEGRRGRHAAILRRWRGVPVPSSGDATIHRAPWASCALAPPHPPQGGTGLELVVPLVPLLTALVGLAQQVVAYLRERRASGDGS